MPMATKTRAEQETIIRRAADEEAWEVFSEDPVVVRKLTSIHGLGKAKGSGMVWTVPRKGISFRKPVVLGAAEKQRRASQFKKV